MPSTPTATAVPLGASPNGCWPGFVRVPIPRHSQPHPRPKPLQRPDEAAAAGPWGGRHVRGHGRGGAARRACARRLLCLPAATSVDVEAMQEERRVGRSYSDADAAADLAAYFALKRAVSIRSLASVAVVALLVVRWLPFPALALATGGLCGVINAQLTGSSGELLLKNRTVGLFVLSSFLRIR